MYKRVIRVEARSDPTAEPFFATEELKVHIEMESSLPEELTQARVSIYNLSLENSQALRQGDYEAGSIGEATNDDLHRPKVHLRVYAGYEDERLSSGVFPLVLEGWVMNATAVRDLPHFITHLYVLPISSSFLRMTFQPFAATPEMTLETALTKMCLDAGYDKAGIAFYLTSEVLRRSVRGASFAPNPDLFSTLMALGTEHSFRVARTTSGIGFYPVMDDTQVGHEQFNHLQENGEPYHVSPLIVVQPPTVGIMTMTIGIIFDGRIHPGWVLDIEDLMGTRGDTSLPANGIAGYDSVGDPIFYTDDVAKYGVLSKYMVERIVTKLDNWGPEWHSTIVGTVPTIGDTGRGEQWQ